METGASLTVPVKVRKLQRALHAQVKGALACREERGAGAPAEAVQAVAPVAEPEAPGEVGEGRALPGWTTVVGHGRERQRVRPGQLPVGEGMISDESSVRENRTLGSRSGERKRGQGGD